MLELEELTVNYSTRQGDITAVDRVSLRVAENEIVGIVGESGCGKSTLAAAIPGLLDENGYVAGGSCRFRGRELTGMDEQSLREDVRGTDISMVFQDPGASLDPVFTVGQQLVETITRHFDVSDEEARERAISVLDDVGIPDPADRLDEYPHSFSGGMQQRVLIAIALACEPDLLIADEPTTGLDVSIQAQILKLLRDINESRGTSVLLITHDLGVVAQICDRVCVMYAGNTVEVATTANIFENPKHPYTEALLASIPDNATGERLEIISGSPPELNAPPSGCRYHPRCEKVCSEACETGDIPPMYDDGGMVRCYLYDTAENPEYGGETREITTREQLQR